MRADPYIHDPYPRHMTRPHLTPPNHSTLSPLIFLIITFAQPQLSMTSRFSDHSPAYDHSVNLYISVLHVGTWYRLVDDRYIPATPMMYFTDTLFCARDIDHSASSWSRDIDHSASLCYVMEWHRTCRYYIGHDLTHIVLL